MIPANATFRGIVHGKCIEFSHDLGLPDGQEVTITVQSAGHPTVPGDGLRSSFGGWADDHLSLDEFLEWNRKERQRGRRDIEP